MSEEALNVDAEFDAYFQAADGHIGADLPRRKEARSVANAARLETAAAEQAEQANKMRWGFFWFGVSAASICVFTSATFMLVSQIWGQRMSDATSVAFISGLSVQAIGITKIMAGYLFPSPGKPEDKP